MKPGNAKPRNFNDHETLYNHKRFSIAWGKGKDEKENRLAMRWDVIYHPNRDEKHNGYPVQGSNPVWFNFADPLTRLFLEMLYNSKCKGIKKEAIKRALEECRTS
jgi:hypothetical protein